MPLIGPDEMYGTTRTPAPGTLSEIGAKIAEIKQGAAGRGVEIDFALPYLDASVEKPRVEVERHREAFGQLEKVGTTWVIINRSAADPAEILEFIEAFAETYIRT